MKEAFFEQYPYLCDTFHITKKVRIEKGEIEASGLISPYRLDFMAKLLLLDSFDGKYEQKQAAKLYEEHLLKFSNHLMMEPGQCDKKGLACYWNTFQEIRSRLQYTDEEVLDMGNPIPIDGKHMAMDGAHRISAAIYYGKKIGIYQVNKRIRNKYDFLFFRKRCLREDYIVEMVKKYVSMRSCRLYRLKKTQVNRRLRKKIYKEASPVYMKQLPKELVVIVDTDWLEQFGEKRGIEDLPGTDYLKETADILRFLDNRQQELTGQGRFYKYKSKWRIFWRKNWSYSKIKIKQLLGKPV